MPEPAIDHAEMGDDVGRVNRLMLLNGQRAFAAGCRETVRRWLSWLDNEDLVEQYPAGRGARCTVLPQRGRCGRRRTLGHCRGTSIAGAAPQGKQRRMSACRPIEFSLTAARWRVGVPSFAASSVGTASRRCDVTWRACSTG